MLKLIIAPLLAWIIAHSIKIILKYKKIKKIDTELFLKAGGMPSGHSATVAALTYALYLEQGFTALFAVTVIFSLIVIRGTTIRPKEQRHKPIEIFAGIFLGLLVTYLIYFI